MTHIRVLLPVSMQNAIFSKESRDGLETLGEVRWNERDEHLTEEEAFDFLHGADVVVGSWRTVTPTGAILDRCPTIKLWEHAAGSVKGFFTDELKGRELLIASCAPAIGQTVAELVLGELIIGMRRVLPNVVSNRTNLRAPLPGRSYLAVSTIGVIGASQVGRLVMQLLRPFGAMLLVYDPFLSAEEAQTLGATKAESVLELCRAADGITIHTPLTPETRHMLGAREFQAMKDDAVFINASRGACIDEAALIAELQKGRLFAFLDVSDPEPAASDNPIRHLPNAVYTSHIAGGPSIHIGRQVVQDIEAFTQGGKPRMTVTWEMLDRLA
ncbi:hydroxyacid dehydrogenase [Paenibacillus sp. HJGM_3]|uniref:hydroxyacid dehydrogenase n=1 Tax=Paenibacillus sp. HJGM_3 TaxID=3379816 RepID=UPI00385EC3D6